ncbi:MAG: hypothetical protein KC620_20740, partial [Myxococcales bacterium]|nr:hypothetical protein [Myxococcales bacterium]
EHCAPGEPPPPPPPAACEDRCHAAAREAYNACLNTDAAPERCEQMAHERLAACLEHCSPADPPPPPDAGVCEDGCARRGMAAFDACIAEGGARDRCAHLAEEWTASCIAEHCVDQPDPEPLPVDCEDACHARAAEVNHICLANGGAAERCASQAREAFATCVDAHCAPAPEPEPAPVACEDACHARAAAMNDACLAAGGAPERCALQAREAFATCVDAHCAAPEPAPEPEPAPVDCEDACHARAAAVNEACLAAGGGADRCALQAREAFATCVDAHCAAPEPAPEPAHVSCEGYCGTLARTLFFACLNRTGDRDACARQTEGVGAGCVELRCGGDGISRDVCLAQCDALDEAYRAFCDGPPNDLCPQSPDDRLHACQTAICGG